VNKIMIVNSCHKQDILYIYTTLYTLILLIQLEKTGFWSHGG